MEIGHEYYVAGIRPPHVKRVRMSAARQGLPEIRRQAPGGILKSASNANDRPKPRQPRGKNQDVLRHLAHVHKLLAQMDDKHTIRAWFVGINPMLNDDAQPSLPPKANTEIYLLSRAHSSSWGDAKAR